MKRLYEFGIIEMMKFGFMSFLLTIMSEVPISKICINKDVATYFLPCKDAAELTGFSATHTSTSQFDVAPATNESEVEVNYCEAKVKQFNLIIFLNHYILNLIQDFHPLIYIH